MRSRLAKILSGTGMIILYLLLCWVLPLIISIGRILSSAGAAMFIFPKFVNFIDEMSRHHNSTIISSNSTLSINEHISCSQSTAQQCLKGLILIGVFTAITCNIIVNLSTRVPKIFNQFRTRYKRLKNNEADTAAESYFDFQDMPWISRAIYIPLKIINLASGSFVALSTYLSIKSLLSFFEQCLFHTDLGKVNPVARVGIYESLALLFAITSMANYLIYNIAAGDASAKKLSLAIANRARPEINCSSFLTIALTLPAIACVGGTAKFTTIHALKEICWMKIPSPIVNGISTVSIMTAITGRSLTDIPATRKTISDLTSSNTSLKKKRSLAIWLYMITVYVAGSGDSGGTAVSTFTSTINTAEMLTGIPKTNPYLIALIALCSLSMSVTNLSFGVHDGVEGGIDLFFNKKPALVYSPLPTDSHAASINTSVVEEDIELGLSKKVLEPSTGPQLGITDITQTETTRSLNMLQ